jgi:hypothetical protein
MQISGDRRRFARANQSQEEAAEGHRTALKRAKTSPEICPTSNPALTGRVRSGTKDHRSNVFLLCKWLRFG